MAKTPGELEPPTLPVSPLTPPTTKSAPVRRLSQKRKRIEVELDDGMYTLFELDSRTLGNWRTDMAERAQMDAKGNVRIQNFGGAEASFICLCIKKNSGENVEAAVIDTWPAGTVTELFRMCQELNGQTEAAAEAVKKA